MNNITTKSVGSPKLSLNFFIGAGFIAVTLLVAIIIMSAPSFARADALNRQLEVEMTGTDVSALQTFLAEDITLYPQGLVTGYYGFLTEAAVSNFQARNGISPVGRVGPVTLPVLNFQMANGANVGTDVYAPTITSVNLNTTNTSATISWATSDMAQGKVYYSTTPIRISNIFDQTGLNSAEPTVSGNLAQYDGIARTYQTVNISGLTPNTNYFYLIVSFDWSNNVSLTLPSYFTTKQ